MLCGECEERRREFFYTRAAEEDYWNICRKISREKLIMLSPVNKPLLLKLCSFTSHVPTPHCTMDPAMDIDISKVYKRFISCSFVIDNFLANGAKLPIILLYILSILKNAKG